MTPVSKYLSRSPSRQPTCLLQVLVMSSEMLMITKAIKQFLGLSPILIWQISYSEMQARVNLSVNARNWVTWHHMMSFQRVLRRVLQMLGLLLGSFLQFSSNRIIILPTLFLTPNFGIDFEGNLPGQSAVLAMLTRCNPYPNRMYLRQQVFSSMDLFLCFQMYSVK